MSSEQIALLVVGAFLGLFEQVRLVDFVKNILKVDGTWAKLLAAAVAVLLSLGALFITGQVHLADFTLADLPYVFAPVYALAEIVYYFKRERGG